MCLTSKTFPCPTLRDLACLFPLSHLGMTSFLPNEWEASAPQIRSRLPWFPPGQPAAPPPSSIFQPQQWAAPSHSHFPETLLLVEEFLSFLLAVSRSHNRKAVTSLISEKELVFYLRISLSFETTFSGWLGRHAQVCFLVFFCFFLFF